MVVSVGIGTPIGPVQVSGPQKILYLFASIKKVRICSQDHVKKNIGRWRAKKFPKVPQQKWKLLKVLKHDVNIFYSTLLVLLYY
jgi:hypothetical protein